MVVLGVDPGTAVTGYGIIQCGKPDLNLLGTGYIQTDRSLPFALRLKKIYDGLTDVILEYRPQHLALEEAFYSRNVKTALMIGHVRGVVLLAAAHNGVQAVEYAPRQVKQAVTGNGDAAKIQVQSMVQNILMLDQSPKPFDIADALAIAICHCHRIQLLT